MYLDKSELERLNKENNDIKITLGKLVNDFSNTSSTDELSKITKLMIKLENKILENIKLMRKIRKF